MARMVITPRQLELTKLVRPDMELHDKFQLYKSLAVPSYVHGYGLCIEYYKRWFESRFSHDYFRGGIYIEGKHVLDEYKTFDKAPEKRENPRARIIPTLDTDFDRDGIDTYLASPQVYLRRSNYQDSFFKDYDKRIFLGLQMKAMKMTFNTKIRVNTRAEQLDLLNFMQLNFRNGATSYEYLSLDFHIPKKIIVGIAEAAGFHVFNNDEIEDIIDFLNYFNQHSDLILLYKIRAINKKPEFFLRIPDVYTHIVCKDKITKDDGERDGKLDSNFSVEMENIVTMPVPAFYFICNQTPIMVDYKLEAHTNDMTALYSINIHEVPPVDEHGWNQAAITSYAVDKNDTELDISSLFTGENILSRTINLTMKSGVSPSKFINVKVFRNDDIKKTVNIHMNWETKRAELVDGPADQDEVYQIAMYYDREYINNLDIAINGYNDNRISGYNQYHDAMTD